MNNPKEKAKELVDKYSTYVVMWSGGIEVATQNVKQCALIAVDEILNTIEYSSQADELSKVSYWEEVKNEINKL
jgi:hypothetical protein